MIRRAGPSASSMRSTQQVDLVRRQQVGVVDQHVLGRHRPVTAERAELAAQAQHVVADARVAPATTSRSRAAPRAARRMGHRAVSRASSEVRGSRIWRCRSSLVTNGAGGIDPTFDRLSDTSSR